MCLFSCQTSQLQPHHNGQHASIQHQCNRPPHNGLRSNYSLFIGGLRHKSIISQEAINFITNCVWAISPDIYTPTKLMPALRWLASTTSRWLCNGVSHHWRDYQKLQMSDACSHHGWNVANSDRKRFWWYGARRSQNGAKRHKFNLCHDSQRKTHAFRQTKWWLMHASLLTFDHKKQTPTISESQWVETLSIIWVNFPPTPQTSPYWNWCGIASSAQKAQSTCAWI